ncbi:MAG: HEAT repeat domain-containing protein [Spirochaetota bacterium]
MSTLLPHDDFIFDYTLSKSSKDIIKLFSFENPFDFFRHDVVENPYIVKTQHKLRKAFSEGLLGIEHYLMTATSLRPLIDEAQDLDEITRLFSQQKLAMRPNPHSVKILRTMIKDPNPEIALYAAEGLNTIENSFLTKIEKVKKKLEKASNNIFIYHYLLGLLYTQFAALLESQKLIQKFYIKQAIGNLIKAYTLQPKNKRIKIALADSYLLDENFEYALSLYTHCYSIKYKPVYCLLKMAQCHYNLKNYDRIKTIASIIAQYDVSNIEYAEVLIYQWIL